MCQQCSFLIKKHYLIFNRKEGAIWKNHVGLGFFVLHSVIRFQVVKLHANGLGKSPQNISLSFITYTFSVLALNGRIPFLMSTEKQRASIPMEETHQDMELSDAPNITYVSLLINQSQWFESKIFYQNLLLSVCCVVQCLGMSPMSSVSHPCLAPEGFEGKQKGKK